MAYVAWSRGELHRATLPLRVFVMLVFLAFSHTLAFGAMPLFQDDTADADRLNVDHGAEYSWRR